jgi:hypothetical protein
VRFIPRVDGLEFRALLSTLTVTTNADSGMGSLRDTIAVAGDGDTINFASSLAGQTITLTSGEIAIDKSLNILGPGASTLAVSGNKSSRIFDIAASHATTVTISGLTIKNGLANQGGGILDLGSSLTLTSCTLANNQAVGAAGAPFNDASGGALAVLGSAPAGMTVTITGCEFLSNSATGGAGGPSDGVHPAHTGGAGVGGAIFVDAQFSAGFSFTASGTNFRSNSAAGGAGGDNGGSGGVGQGGAVAWLASVSSGAAFHLDTASFFNLNQAVGGRGSDGGVIVGAGGTGGAAQGGAVWIDAGSASQPLFVFSTDAFGDCHANGNRGGDSVGGQLGGRGGGASGGVLFYTADTAAGPVLTVNISSFNANSAFGGPGGRGGNIDSTLIAPGGGNGGESSGGAVFADFQNSAGASDTFTRDTFNQNTAFGGGGGTGGANGPRGIGGGGGGGGPSEGGGLSITITDQAAATQLTIARCAITNNLARNGKGGDGGSGGTGGEGSSNFFGEGGGLWFRSAHRDGGAGDTWILDSDTIANNVVTGGDGGAGGTGTTGTGGNGGDAGFAVGGGIDDEVAAALHILHCAIIRNRAARGSGGLGGIGPAGNGSNGGSIPSDAGGIRIITGIAGPVCKTADTKIALNQADINPDVDGTIGAC